MSVKRGDKMKEGQILTKISEAIIKGLEILNKMEILLKNEKGGRPYPIKDIEPLKNEGKINFNFHCVKLFLKFRLESITTGHSGMPGNDENIRFKYPLIWGRYTILKNGIEIETPIVTKYKILDSQESDLLLEVNRCQILLKESDGWPSVFDKIISECLPETMINMKNIKWD